MGFFIALGIAQGLPSKLLTPKMLTNLQFLVTILRYFFPDIDLEYQAKYLIMPPGHESVKGNVNKSEPV
jgi:hypothetical protein